MAKRDETRVAAHHELGANWHDLRAPTYQAYSTCRLNRDSVQRILGVFCTKQAICGERLNLNMPSRKPYPTKSGASTRVLSLYLPAFWQLSSGDVRSENAAKSA
jgi:hypothetical protein